MAYIGKTPSQAVRSRYFYTATGGETSLSGADDNGDTLIFADGNYVDVYLNGVLLVASSDYNVNTVNTIAGLTALTASDIVEIVVYDTFSVFGGVFQGDLSADTITGDMFGSHQFEAKNIEGSTIPKGTPVYIAGHSGNDPEIAIADADDPAKMPAFGITTAAIANNTKGNVIVFGNYIGIDTSSFSVGDELYVSNTGTLINTRPSASADKVQKIAKVIRSQSQNGQIFVMGAGRSNDVPNAITANSINLSSTTTVDSVLDEDTMTSDSATALATQQSIKAYVDSQIGSNNELSEILTNGNTTGGNDISFDDNDKAVFGAGSDLQIYHDGLNSYITDSGTGNLRIQAQELLIEDPSGNDYFYGISGAQTAMCYAGTAKVQTTSTGVDVTGTVTAQAPTATDGLITVKGASGDFSGGIALVADAGENATDWFRIASIQSGGSHDLRVSTSSDTTPTWDTHFLNINSGGDISFYEDTGSTVKFFWDSSNEGIALGNNQLSGDWGHYFPVIEVGGRGAFWSDSTGWSGTPRTHFSNNVSRNDAGTLKYIESDPASVIDLDADVFKFSNAAAGSAGSTLTLTERLRIDSSGNVGIGTSSPSEELTISRSDDARISITSSSTSKASMIGLIEFDGSDGRNSYIGVVSGNMTINTDGGYPIKFQTTGTERMRIDSGGNVGIGTSSPAATSSTYKNLQVALGATVIGRTDDTPLYLSSNLSYDSGWKYIANTTATQIVLSTNMQFFNAPSGTAGTAATLTERMRIASNGDILFGCTSAPSASVVGSGFIKSAYDSELFMSGSLTTGNDLIHFFNPNGKVGSIATNGTSTAYNTSSDYRLKENVVADWDATTRLKQLNPVRFNFIANPDTTVDGFLAHEVQSVVPEAISGTHNEVDDEGNPVYQGIDQSKLVPLLVKTIQELEARITALETA